MALRSLLASGMDRTSFLACSVPSRARRILGIFRLTTLFFLRALLGSSV